MKNVCGLIALVLAGNALAQGAANPEAAMLRYIDAAKDWDAERIAASMHPDALERVRVALEDAFSGPNATQARAELLPLFASSFAEFSELSGREIFARLNDAVSAGAPELLELMAAAEYEILGQVERGDEVYLTYIITMTIEGRELEQQVVQRLKQHEGEWFLLLPPDGEASIAGIEAQFPGP